MLPRETVGVPRVLAVFEINGGELPTLAPGIEFIVGWRLVLEASVPLSIYERLRGEQVCPPLTR